MLPPMLLYVKVSTRERKRIGIWLPLFLVWLILLPLVALMFAVTVAVDLVLILADQPYHHYTLLLARVFGVLGDCRGTTVHVNADHTNVRIDLV
jgi:hypothetical protein